uniref:Core-2/I-branching beta-16-N-acetylglucosaminyltransferase family protein n=1 Tax=Aegilops tauschii subsp. strangulata TaxID=200361 RepID=A0A453JGF2_AEGTS
AKLLRPVLLSAVLATGFLAAALLMFFGGASSYYRLPRLAVPDALLPAPTCDQEDGDQQGGAAQRWWARPPARSAWHNMSEEELLWAASFEPRAHQRRPPGRRGRTPKVAFLFLTRGPLPLAPLWERFFNSTGTKGRELFSVYVHTTPGYRLDFPPSSPFHRRQVPSKADAVGQRECRGRGAAAAGERAPRLQQRALRARLRVLHPALPAPGGACLPDPLSAQLRRRLRRPEPARPGPVPRRAGPGRDSLPVAQGRAVVRDGPAPRRVRDRRRAVLPAVPDRVSGAVLRGRALPSHRALH